MRTLPTLPVFLAAAGLLFAAPTLQDASPRFAPAAGTTVVKTFRSSMDMELDDMSVSVDGDDGLDGLGAPQVRMKFSWDMTVSDEYLAVAEGRPTRLARTFEELESRTEYRMSMLGESESEDTKSGSELQGRSVLFTWDPRREEYTATWAEGSGGDAALLADLEEDMDLRFLLPDGPLEAGASWELPLERLLDLILPGGDLAFEDSSDSTDGELDEIFERLSDMFDPSSLGSMLRGKHEVTFVGTRELDGRAMGVLAVDIDLTADMDLASMLGDLSSLIGDADLPIDIRLDVARMGGELRLKGEALWDLAAGHVHGATFEGDMGLEVELRASIEFFGESQSIEAELLMSGLLRSELTTETR